MRENVRKNDRHRRPKSKPSASAAAAVGVVCTGVKGVSLVGRNCILVVPYDDNTRLLKERYEAGEGQITVKVIPGKGHQATRSFFECQELMAS
jgi:hypothetical protein